MSIKKGVIEVSPLAGQFFPTLAQDDLVMRTTHDTQQILIGVLSNANPAVLIKGSNVGFHKANPQYPVDVQGVLHTSSNILTDGRIAINGVSPSVGLEVHTTDAILLPKGTTVERPANPVQGHVRYNTTTSQFEGFGSGNAWGSLGGVKDTNQDTYISAESYPTSNDDQLRFINSNIERMRITNVGDIGIGTTAPTERVDIRGNLKVTSNVYFMQRVGVANSNPSEGLDVTGSIKASQDVYAMDQLGVRTSNPTEAVDVVGNAKISSNIYAMVRMGIATSNPTEALDVTGSIKASQDMYAMDQLGVRTSNPSEAAEIVGNAKVTSNIYAMVRMGIATSNPTEALHVSGSIKASQDVYAMDQLGVRTSNPSEAAEIVGNAKVTSNIYAMVRLGIATSNPTEALDVNGSIKASQDVYAMDQLGVRTSNPSEAVDVIGSIKASQDMYAMDQLGVGTSNPSEAAEIVGNAKVTSNIYAMVRMGIATSNPTEAVDIIGSIKASQDVYAMDQLGVGTSNPSEAAEIVGNAKVTSNIYAMNRIAVANSNPTEAIDVTGSIKASQDIYAMDQLGVGTSNPSETVDIVGNTKISNDLYVMGYTGMGTSNPTEMLDVTDNIKAGYNVYAMSGLGIGTSNITSAVDIVGDLNIVGNITIQGGSILATAGGAGVWVADNDDIYYALGSVAIGNNDFSEAFTTTGNAKFNNKVYVKERLAVGHSNPSEAVDVIGSIKASQDMYVMDQLGVRTSNASEAAHIVGNAKVTSNVYALSRLGVATSNPTEAAEIQGNLKVSQNTYVMSNLGVGVSNPNERLVVDGNITATGTIRTCNLMVLGDYVVMNTTTSNTEQMTITNDGTGPALRVAQMGPNPIAAFYDDSNIALMVADQGKVAINSETPSVTFEVHGKDAMLLPKGTTLERPGAPVQGHIRYNTDINQFEGFGAGMAWGSLGGVKDTNQDTYISAESHPTSNDDVLRFYNSNVETMRITKEGYVGIGTSNVSERLRVLGDTRLQGKLTVTGHVLPSSNEVYDLGSSNARFRDIYLSGNSIDLGGLKLKQSMDRGKMSIMVMNDSNQLTESKMQQLTLSNLGEVALYTSNHKLGINKTNPEYHLDTDGDINAKSNIYAMGKLGVGTRDIGDMKAYIAGALYAEGYCNILVDTYNSNTIHRAPTAAALKAVYDFALPTSNDFYPFMGLVYDDLYPKSIYGSNTAFYSSNVATWTSNNALTKNPEGIFTNLALGTSNPQLGTLVVSTSNAGTTLIYAENLHNTNDAIIDLTNKSSNADSYVVINAPHNAVRMGITSGTKGGNFIIDTSNDIVMSTNQQETLRISEQGTVSIGGVALPQNKLHVAGNVQADGFYLQRASDDSALYMSLASDCNDNILLRNQTSNAGIYMATATGDGTRNIIYVGGKGQSNGDPGQVTLDNNVNLLLRQGRVGIGTLTPGTEFDVTGNANITGIVETARVYASGMRVRKNTASTVATRCNILSTDILYSPYTYMKFNTSYSNEVGRFIDGKFGINTFTPTERLEVNGNAIISSNLNVGGKLTFRNSYAGLQDLPVASNVPGMLAHVTATGSMYFASSNTSNWEKLASFTDLSWTAGVESNIYRLQGKVGIGLSNPSEALEVHGNAITSNLYAQRLFFRNSFATINDLPSPTTYAGMFAFVQSTGKSYFANGTAWIAIAGTLDIPFTLSNNMVYTTQNNYKLGIGTSNPQEALHVTQNIKSSNIYPEKVYFRNTFCNLSDLPEASNYQGMFSHVWALGRAYVANAGAWNPLATTDDVPFTSTSSNIYFNRLGNVGIGVSNAARKLHVSGDVQASNIYPEKVYFKNIFANSNDLPSPSNMDGMFAVVSSTRKSYFALSNQWIPIASSNDVGWVAAQNTMYFNGEVGVNTADPTEALEVNGNIKTTSNIFSEVAYFRNRFATEASLPSAESNQGMFAFVTENNRSYFSTGTNWKMLADSNDVVLTWVYANCNISFQGTGEISGNFKHQNMYSNLSSLPSATQYSGMFASLLTNELPYFATPSSGWQQLARIADVPFQVLDASRATSTLSNIGIRTNNPDSNLALDVHGQVAYNNTWSTMNDLPNASTYVGMVALVTADGNPYIATNDGLWTRLAFYSNIPFTKEGSNVVYLEGAIGIGTSNLESNVGLRVSRSIMQNSVWTDSNTLPLSDENYGSIAYIPSSNLTLVATSNEWKRLAYFTDNPWSSNSQHLRYNGGRVGVGIGETQTPVATLEVRGAVMSSNAWTSCNDFPAPSNFIGTVAFDTTTDLAYVSKGNEWSRLPETRDLAWSSNNSNLKYNGGSVGIGTQGNEPQALLDVRGQVVYQNQWSLLQDLPAASNHAGTVAYVNNDQRLYVSTSNNWNALPYLNQAGGLNLQGPLLHQTIYTSCNTLPTPSNYSGTTVFVSDEQRIYASTSNQWQKIATTYDIGWARSTVNASNVTFQDGNVGIGTSNPQALLQVQGTVLFANSYGLCNSFPAPNNCAGTTVYSQSNNRAYVSRSNDWLPLLTQDDVGWTRNATNSNFYNTTGSFTLGGSNTPAALLEVKGSVLYNNVWDNTSQLAASGSFAGVIAYTSSDDRIYVSRSNSWTPLVTMCNIPIASNLPPTVAPGEFAYVATDDKVYVSLYSNVWRPLLTGGSSNSWYEYNSNVVYTSTGKIGVGTSNPLYTMDVYGTGRFTDGVYANQALYLDNNTYGNTNQIQFRNDSNVFTIQQVDIAGSNYLRLGRNGVDDLTTSEGKIGVGTSTPSYTLHVIGDVYATGNVAAFSDSNFKDDLQVISGAIEKICSLTGYTYTRKDDVNGTRFAGLLAQEVASVLPEVVMKDSQNRMSLAYGNLAALFVQAIKEQQEEIANLKNMIKQLL